VIWKIQKNPKNTPGRMIKRGKLLPWHPPFRMTTQVVPPLEIHQYIYFTLHKHYFIGGLKKHVHKNVQNKIYIKYQPLENVRRGRSR